MPSDEPDGIGARREPIMPEPGRHSWTDLLRLVDDVRRLAHDRSLAPDGAMRHIRDVFGVYDGIFDADR